MSNRSPLDSTVLKVIHASLRLVNSSSELLTFSQLHAIRGELFKTLAIVDDQIRVAESGTYAHEEPFWVRINLLISHRQT